MNDFAPDEREQSPAVVHDPEDFNRQQRFKEIHDARQRVANYISKLEDRIDPERHKPGTAPMLAQEQLAFRVSMYVTELLPLLKKKGGDDPYMAEHFPDGFPANDLEHYAMNSGMFKPHTDRINKKERTTALPVTDTLRVFQIANLAYSKLGMDLEVSEDRGDSGFDYSDILEEGPPGGGEAPNVADGVADE